MFIIKGATSIRHQAKNVYYLNFNHNTFTKVNRFNKSIRYTSSSSSSLKLKEEVVESTPITTNSKLPILIDYIRFLVLSNKQEEAQDLLISFSKCNVKVDPFTACIIFVNSTNFNKISPSLSGKLMRYSSIYGSNPLLNNISRLDKIENNWLLYNNFKRIGYKVDLPLHLYIISQICSNPGSSWEFLKVSINNLKSCEEFRNSKLKLPTRLVNSWIKFLIDAERFDLVSLLLDELKPEFDYKTYQLLIYAQSSYNQTLFPHFDMLSILQKSMNLNIKLSPPLAARIISYLHNKNHHTELLNWLEIIRDQKTRIPKVTLNKIISELGASEYYSVILRIWEILSKHPDPFNNHIITTILNAFSKANLEQTDYILTNIIEILKKQNIPLSTSIFNVLMKHSNLKNQPHLTDLYFQQIQENNLKLTAYSYNLMLQKSYKLNDLPTIEGIYELVQTNWFKPNEITYLWLLDIYTELGNWDRVQDILDLIPLKLINNNLKLQKKVEVARKKLEGDNDEYNS